MNLNLFCLLLISGININGISNPFSKKETAEPKNNFNTAQDLLNQIQKDLQDLRGVITVAIDKNRFDNNKLYSSMESLKKNSQKTNIIQSLNVESLEKEQIKKLKDLARDILKSYVSLQEESHVLDIYLKGYSDYEKDLNNNFKNLPNKFFRKPDNKKLYQEIGLTDDYATKAPFDKVRSAYKEKYDMFKKSDSKNFQQGYFDPYLRVIDYVFRTPYGKTQYDNYLIGESKYNEKMKILGRYKLTIENFLRELPIVGINLSPNLASLAS